MKKRAFDADEVEEREPSAAPPQPEPTEPAPRARTAVAFVLASWLLPLRILYSLLTYSEDEPTTQLVHRIVTITSVGLVLVGLGFAIRGIDAARKNPRIRRRLAYVALLTGLLTPLVWATELALALRMVEIRERLDSSSDAPAPSPDASSPAAE